MTMAETKMFVANAPVWVDLSSTDADKARDYYSELFGWKVEVAPDPDAGGYALANLNGKAVAGIGPARTLDGPSRSTVYVGAHDADIGAKPREAAGGKAAPALVAEVESAPLAVAR